MRAAVYDRFTNDFDDITVREIEDRRCPRRPSSSRSRPPASIPSTGSSSAAGSISSCPPSSPSSRWDVAGTVIGLGFDTPEFAIGDEVVAYARKDVLGGGTFARRSPSPSTP